MNERCVDFDIEPERLFGLSGFFIYGVPGKVLHVVFVKTLVKLSALSVSVVSKMVRVFEAEDLRAGSNLKSQIVTTKALRALSPTKEVACMGILPTNNIRADFLQIPIPVK